jgi:hypothetical protein
MSRPDLTASILALRLTDPRFPSIQPTGEEIEVADLLEELQALHVPSAAVPDNPGEHRLYHTYGRCLGCGETWPCKGWVNAEQMALQWLGRASDRVWARVQETIAKQKGSAA